MREAVKRLARAAGVELRRFQPERDDGLRLAGLLKARGLDTVLDVGANRGQFAEGLWRAGYGGRILSYEPQAGAFAALERAARRRPGWSARRCAIGTGPSPAPLQLFRNDQLSSFRTALACEAGRIDGAQPVGVEAVEVLPLSAVLEGEPRVEPSRAALKLDVQGVELDVLASAGERLEQFGCILTEMTLRPFYTGEPEFREVFDWITERGFRCVGLSAGYADRETFEVRQVDGVFVRR